MRWRWAVLEVNGARVTMGDGSTGQPENDVYTILVILATVVVGAATVFLAMQSQRLFGSWNPFTGA